MPPSQLTRWALEEVRALCPHWFSSLFLGAPPVLPLVFSDATKQINIKAGQVNVPPTLLTSSGTPASPKAPRMAVVDVDLPQSMFLTRQISAPAKAAGQLRAIASLDLTRRAPFKPGEVVWTLSLPTRDGDKVRATQWVIRRDEIERLESRLLAVGLIARKIRVEKLPENVAALTDLSKTKTQKTNFWIWTNGVIATAIIFCVGYAWLAPAVQNANSLVPEMAVLEKARSEAVALRQEVETLRSAADARGEFLHDIVYRPKLSETLRDLTVALPDSVWLSELSFNQTGVVVMGEAEGSAADLVISLTSVRNFSNPRLSGSISRSPSGGEQFEISLDHKVVR